MATAQQTTALIGVFADHRQAERFVDELKLAGFRDDQIGMMRRGPETGDTPVGDNAVAGALTGTALGALTGAALTAGLIPGVGPMLVGGVLLGILSGATAGAAAGGILGALIDLGVPKEEARRYENEVRAGRTLVVVQAAGRFPEAFAILRHVEEGAAKPLPPSHHAPEVEQLDDLT
jgi:hypothetical protein